MLLAAAALLTWGYVFVDNQVTIQLSVQKIAFPAAGSAALKAHRRLGRLRTGLSLFSAAMATEIGDKSTTASGLSWVGVRGLEPRTSCYQGVNLAVLVALLGF